MWTTGKRKHRQIASATTYYQLSEMKAADKFIAERVDRFVCSHLNLETPQTI